MGQHGHHSRGSSSVPQLRASAHIVSPSQNGRQLAFQLGRIVTRQRATALADRAGPFRVCTHGQAWHTERRRLFLPPTGVGDNQSTYLRTGHWFGRRFHLGLVHLSGLAVQLAQLLFADFFVTCGK